MKKAMEKMDRRVFLKSGVRLLFMGGLSVVGLLGLRKGESLEKEHCVYLNQCGPCKIYASCQLSYKKVLTHHQPPK